MNKYEMNDESCDLCVKKFSTKSNLNKHKRKVHGVEPTVIRYDGTIWSHKCLENGCNVSFRRNEDLVSHLETDHNFHIERQLMILNSFPEFNVWKSEIEVKEKCNYVLARGKSKTPNGNEISTYVCNRSGKYRQRHCQDKRFMKRQGTCKIDKACISEIRVVKRDRKLRVQRICTHYGHTVDLQHLRISKQDRAYIVSKLLMGLTKQDILREIKECVDADSELKRLHLLTTQDIDNIRRSIRLVVQDQGQGKHQMIDEDDVEELEDSKEIAELTVRSDFITIDLWVRECLTSSASCNPILLYKQHGEEEIEGFNTEEFCLVIMNEQHKLILKRYGSNFISLNKTEGGKGYNYTLTTLTVVDEFQEPIPVVFMFTNRKEPDVEEFFLKLIKSVIGLIKCDTLMTDTNSVMYDAWVGVMGPTVNHLYSSWSVDRGWQQSLSEILVKEKRTLLYKEIKRLQETLDETTFMQDLVETVEMMIQDKDTEEFGQYFQCYYLNSYESWAHCMRKDRRDFDNDLLYSMYRSIENLHLNGIKVKRLDKSIHGVLKYVRDKILNVTVKNLTGNVKNLSLTKEVISCHEESTKVSYSIAKLDKNEWLLRFDNQEYVLKQMLSTKTCCDLTCSICETCCHAFTCSCADYFIIYRMCQHIHYFVTNHVISPTVVVEGDEPSRDEIVDEEKEQLLDDISNMYMSVSDTNWANADENIVEQIKCHVSSINDLINNAKIGNLSRKRGRGRPPGKRRKSEDPDFEAGTITKQEEDEYIVDSIEEGDILVVTGDDHDYC